MLIAALFHWDESVKECFFQFPQKVQIALFFWYFPGLDTFEKPKKKVKWPSQFLHKNNFLVNLLKYKNC